ncbi:glycosyltransferase family 4 protein [Poseidonibacter antarcticus]|uniref:glycosyltransferase family 4 protein n=1 Tax=Poseidonibacter antarcticus TaxID=2478538 RepID=UPI000EF559B4|nr:glycosyltransferase family 4 protein [Poseidonibacter antarcticus]
MKNKKKILWVSPTNLFDTTSGFALSVKQMLKQLHKSNYAVHILSATIFDKKEGMSKIQQHKEFTAKNLNKFIKILDGDLIHNTFVTKDIKREKMMSYEENIFFQEYCKILEDYQIDLVFTYGDGLLDSNITREAKNLNITTMAYLVNPNFKGKRWIRDIDLIITDSLATSKMYKQREGYDITCVGDFLSKDMYISKTYTKKNILFINPSLQKGVLFVIQLALYLEKIASDIVFEVVNSRGNWQSILKHITKKLGNERESLPNVIVTENTYDMKSVYSRAKLLLVPSFWFDSGPRVIAEAQLNAIPVIGSTSGGIPEMIGKGGLLINFSDEFYKEPYTTLVDIKTIEKIGSNILRFYSDDEYYKDYSKKALEHANKHHNIYDNTKKLVKTIDSLLS